MITGIWFYALVDKIDAKKMYIFWNRYSSDWQHENSNNFRFFKSNIKLSHARDKVYNAKTTL